MVSLTTEISSSIMLIRQIRKAIYFDGYLPPSKLPVRMDRMVKSTSQLNQFHATCSDGCSSHHLLSRQSSAAVDLFTSRQPDAKQLLPPPFLVPAIIDSLRESPQYHTLVHQVPGEADTFCAKHLASHGGMVLTSDSDLLVHDLAGGRVAFLRDISILDGGGSWQSLIYDPRTICQRLGLSPGEAHRMGYEVYRSPQTTISQLARDCAQPVPSRDEDIYEEFCEQYLHHETGSVPLTSGKDLLPIEYLDPRLSELVICLGAEATDRDSAKMFLPVLIESPMRGSAWEPSTVIRQLGYTILRQLVPGATSAVQEYRRVQERQQRGKSIPLLSKEAAKEAVTKFLEAINEAKRLADSNAVSLWWALSLTLDIRGAEEQEKKSHTRRMLEQWGQRPLSPPGAKVPWDVIHFTCQIQASYYSLRILRQVMDLVPNTAQDSFLEKTKSLREALAGIPTLHEFPRVDQALEFLAALPGSNFLHSTSLSEDIPSAGDPETASRKRKKRKGDQAAAASKRTAERSRVNRGSRFSLLLDE